MAAGGLTRLTITLWNDENTTTYTNITTPITITLPKRPGHRTDAEHDDDLHQRRWISGGRRVNADDFRRVDRT